MFNSNKQLIKELRDRISDLESDLIRAKGRIESSERFYNCKIEGLRKSLDYQRRKNHFLRLKLRDISKVCDIKWNS